MRRRRAMTLLEVIIAIALIALLLSALLTFFWETLKVRDQAMLNADRTQVVQQFMAQISEDLRRALPFEKTGFPLETFNGDRRRLTMLVAPLPPMDTYAFYRESQNVNRTAPQQDLREVTYELWIDPEKTGEDGNPLVGGVLRTERRALLPSVREEEVTDEERNLFYVRHELWSHELGYLEFRYFDGAQWSTAWEVKKGNPLPHLVSVTVGFDSLTRDAQEDKDLEQYPLDRYPLGAPTAQVDPNRFSTIVRLPAADVTFSARVNQLAGGSEEEVYQFLGMPGAGGTDRTGTEGGP
jgi:prepilin-type N-terminal cleavage/methylation domain-containing protein